MSTACGAARVAGSHQKPAEAAERTPLPATTKPSDGARPCQHLELNPHRPLFSFHTFAKRTYWSQQTPASNNIRDGSTWASPDGQHRNQTDYILCSQRWRSSTQSARTDQELTVAQIMN